MMALQIESGSTPAPRKLSGWMVLGCMIGFFAIVMTVNGIMATLAVSTFGGVETPSSYQAGLAFAGDVAAVHAQDERGWQVRATVVPTSDGRRIELDARDVTGLPVQDVVAHITFAHPANRRADQAVVLTPTTAGHFKGTAVIPAGQRDLVIELDRDGFPMFRSKSRVILR
jgi:nitrogen fixation protein FixH